MIVDMAETAYFPCKENIEELVKWLKKRCSFNSGKGVDLDISLSPLKDFIFECYKETKNIGISTEAIKNRCVLLKDFVNTRYTGNIRLDCYYGANLFLWLLTGENPHIIEADIELKVSGYRLLSAHENIKLLSPLQFKEDKFSQILRKTFQDNMSIWLLDIGDKLVGMTLEDKYKIMNVDDWYQYLFNNYRNAVLQLPKNEVSHLNTYLNYRHSAFYRDENKTCIEILFTCKDDVLGGGDGFIKKWRISMNDLVIK